MCFLLHLGVYSISVYYFGPLAFFGSAPTILELRTSLELCTTLTALPLIGATPGKRARAPVLTRVKCVGIWSYQ